MLVAAAIHDIDHPALTNKFLAATEHPLSLLHSNRSILESHSLAEACVARHHFGPALLAPRGLGLGRK